MPNDVNIRSNIFTLNEVEWSSAKLSLHLTNDAFFYEDQVEVYLVYIPWQPTSLSTQELILWKEQVRKVRMFIKLQLSIRSPFVKEKNEEFPSSIQHPNDIFDSNQKKKPMAEIMTVYRGETNQIDKMEFLELQALELENYTICTYRCTFNLKQLPVNFHNCNLYLSGIFKPMSTNTTTLNEESPQNQVIIKESGQKNLSRTMLYGENDYLMKLSKRTSYFQPPIRVMKPMTEANYYFSSYKSHIQVSTMKTHSTSKCWVTLRLKNIHSKQKVAILGAQLTLPTQDTPNKPFITLLEKPDANGPIYLDAHETSSLIFVGEISGGKFEAASLQSKGAIQSIRSHLTLTYSRISCKAQNFQTDDTIQIKSNSIFGWMSSTHQPLVQTIPVDWWFSR